MYLLGGEGVHSSWHSNVQTALMGSEPRPPNSQRGARGPPVPTPLAFWAWLFHALGSAGQCPGGLRPWPASIPPPLILPTSLQGHPPTCHLPQTGSWESRRASRVPCETRPTATRSTPPLTLASLGPFSVSGHAVPVGVVSFLVTPDHGGG